MKKYGKTVQVCAEFVDNRKNDIYTTKYGADFCDKHKIFDFMNGFSTCD